ncbi:MAG: hypothetical protein IT547_04580 [Hyphomonadaceae bacterium]|nr:hypothetical protein [Hyphomonadaceae bacterium]
MKLPDTLRSFLAKRRSFKWTAVNIGIAIVVVWGALLLGFHEGRMCYPWLETCREQFFSEIGDAVWLRYWRDWQTLIAGLIAIIAAFIGGFYINKQIQQTANLERDRNAREYEAVRAMMPIYFDKLIDHIITCGKTLKSLYLMNLVGATPRQTEAPQFPPLPMDVATFLQSVVLRAPADVRPPVIAILSELQVFHARLSHLGSRIVRPSDAMQIGASEFDEQIMQAVDLHARGLAFLPYARNLSNDLPNEACARAHYMTALGIMGFDHAQFPALNAKVARKVAGVGDP